MKCSSKSLKIEVPTRLCEMSALVLREREKAAEIVWEENRVGEGVLELSARWDWLLLCAAGIAVCSRSLFVSTSAHDSNCKSCVYHRTQTDSQHGHHGPSLTPSKNMDEVIKVKQKIYGMKRSYKKRSKRGSMKLKNKAKKKKTRNISDPGFFFQTALW